MRNAVIRKKRLKAERAVDDFMRMPHRVIVPEVQMHLPDDWHASRLWAQESPNVGLWPMGALASI